MASDADNMRRLASGQPLTGIPEFPRLLLPDDVKKRFPSLVQWEVQYERRVKEFLKQQSVAFGDNL